MPGNNKHEFYSYDHTTFMIYDGLNKSGNRRMMQLMQRVL